MKRYLALIAMSVLMLNLPAQNPNLDFKFSLKISNQFSYISQKQYDADTTLNDIIYQGKNYKLFQPTLAIQWTDKYQNIQEVELTDLSFAGDHMAHISMKYEYIVNLYKDRGWRLVPSVGIAINPYYAYYKNIPTSSDAFTMTTQFLGARCFITPRLTWFVTPKFFLDLNVNLEVFDMYYKTSTDDDPTIPIGERTNSSINLGTAFPYAVNARIGAGLKF